MAPIPLSESSSPGQLRGEQMATTPQTAYEPHTGRPSALQEKARRHLWMHFTRMGAYDADHEIPIIVRGEGSLRLRRARQALPRRALRPLLRERRPRPGRAGGGRRRPGQGARLLHQLELRPPARDRAGRADRLARPRRPEQGVLHLRRLRGGRVRLEAGRAVPQAPRRLARARRSSPARPPTTAPPSGRSRSPASHRCARRSSRSCPAPATCPTRTTIAGPRIATRSGPPTRSRTRSSSRTRRRSPP